MTNNGTDCPYRKDNECFSAIRERLVWMLEQLLFGDRTGPHCPHVNCRNHPGNAEDYGDNCIECWLEWLEE